MRAGILRRTQKQERSRPQSIVEQRNDLALQIEPEIDHDVPAGNQIEARKGRVLYETVHREDAHLAHLPLHLIRAVLLDKKTLQALGAHMLGHARGVKTLPCDLEPALVYIGS